MGEDILFLHLIVRLIIAVIRQFATIKKRPPDCIPVGRSCFFIATIPNIHPIGQAFRQCLAPCPSPAPGEALPPNRSGPC